MQGEYCPNTTKLFFHYIIHKPIGLRYDRSLLLFAHHTLIFSPFCIVVLYAKPCRARLPWMWCECSVLVVALLRVLHWNLQERGTWKWAWPYLKDALVMQVGIKRQTHSPTYPLVLVDVSHRWPRAKLSASKRLVPHATTLETNKHFSQYEGLLNVPYGRMSSLD